MRERDSIAGTGFDGAESGATLVEYILLLLFLVISIVASLQVIEQQISSSFRAVSSGFQQ